MPTTAIHNPCSSMQWRAWMRSVDWASSTSSKAPPACARDVAPFDFAALRAKFRGPWIANNGYDGAMAERAIASGYADAVAFGRAYIANPDLAERLRLDAPLNPL